MKQVFQKITAILMTFVVVFSTMSFTISEHYCGDHLVDSALFSKAESCGMDMQKVTLGDDCNIDKSDCCDDVVKEFKGQNELETEVSTLKFQQQVFISAFVYTYINLFEGLEKNVVPFKNYSPPLLVRDVQVLDSVFLI
jgi:hypothetical protein